MLFRRLYEDTLAQASYIVGCQATGEALVVDPHRDVEAYVEAARQEGVRITHVTETHIHADYVSGSRELAARTGAKLLLSGHGGPDWSYRFGQDEGAIFLREGDAFRVGNIEFRVLHTPGHTPEHLTFAVVDTPASDEPLGLITGDFLFVGDVGRPDLLEKAAGLEGTMEEGARTLWESLERVREMPDHLQVWPGHGAGSACGKALGAVPQSTLGYEKLVNWAFQAPDRESFVRAVLDDQPEPPRYFARMKAINRDGPPILREVPRPRHLDPSALEGVLEADGIVVDLRSRPAHAGGHVPGTLAIPWNRAFTNWAGWLLPYDRPIHLLGSEDAVAQATRALVLIGLDDVTGWFDEGAVEAWSAEVARPPAVSEAVTPDELGAALAEGRNGGRPVVVDVRARTEWDSGHLPGAVHIHLGELAERVEELPADEPVVVYCQSGGRSQIAQSVLERSGRRAVANLAGGIVAWEGEGREVERDGG